jgi:hypothetical protein
MRFTTNFKRPRFLISCWTGWGIIKDSPKIIEETLSEFSDGCYSELRSDESNPVFEQKTGFSLDKLPLIWQNPLTL